MRITDIGTEYKVCDECGERFYAGTGVSTIPNSTNAILTGHYHFEEQLADVCTRCAEREKVDVCHGSCLKWHYKTALNQDGLCAYCEGDEISTKYDNPLITGRWVGEALAYTLRDYDQVNLLISKAVILHVPLEVLVKIMRGVNRGA
jgi:hypothetical protein